MNRTETVEVSGARATRSNRNNQPSPFDPVLEACNESKVDVSAVDLALSAVTDCAKRHGETARDLALAIVDAFDAGADRDDCEQAIVLAGWSKPHASNMVRPLWRHAFGEDSVPKRKARKSVEGAKEALTVFKASHTDLDRKALKALLLAMYRAA